MIINHEVQMTVIDLYNGYIKVSSPSDELREYLSGLLYYQDKSKRYQLKKMSKNPFLRASKAYEKLQKESEGNLLEVDGENILVPPGLSDVFKDYQVNDLRTETGTEISLPWKDSQSAIKLRDFQQEAVDIAKCHAKGQLILMFDGSLKPVEEIIVGDLVMGPDSKPRRVLSLTSGFGPMFKITPIKGCSFTVNGDHLLSLRRSYSSLKRSSGKTKHKDRIIDEEIVNISVLEYLKQGQAFKHKYKLYRSNAIDFYEKDLLIDPYILGLWLGDGLSRDSTVVSVDNEIVDSLYSFAKLNELNIRKYEDNITYRLGGNTGLIGSNLSLTALKQLNLLCNKHIPENYKSSSIEQRLQLLAGLIDTDGHYSSGLFDITQKNKKIAEDIVFIARSLGLAAYMKERLKVATNSKEKIKKVYYSVTISGNIDKIPTRVLRKQAPCRKQIKNVLNIGFKVERVNDDSFYGFTVDSDNLYLLSDFTVTHNCNYRGIINFATGLGKTKTAICLIREIKRKTLVVCPSKSIAKQFKEELEERFGSRRVGFIGDGTFKPADITVGIAATVNNNIEKIKTWGLGLIIFDEAHHTPATTFYSIAKDLGDTGRIYGLTATSYRSDGKDIFIQAGCGSILIERDIKWGVDNGWLAKPYFLVRKIDTGDSDPFPDDKLKSYKTHVLNNKEMTVRIEKDALAMISAGKSTLILVDQVEHGELLAKVLKVPFAQGEDKQSEEYIANLNKGKIKGLVATEGKAGEGVDTRNVDCLILANFAGSKGMVIQAVGRGLRKQGTKENCIILDYIPNGSSMLKRHAQNRIKWYEEITENVKVIV